MVARGPARPAPRRHGRCDQRCTYLLAAVVALAGLVVAGGWASLALLAGGGVRGLVWPALTGLASLVAGVVIAVRATDRHHPGA